MLSGASRSSSAALKRCGSSAFTITVSSVRPIWLADALLQLERLGDRHVAGQRHRHVCAALAVLEQLAHAVSLLRDRPHARDRREGLRRSRACRARCPSRGRPARPGHSPRRAAPSARRRQLPDLHHADHLPRPRRRGREVLERAARGEQPSRHASAERLQPLEQSLVGVYRDAPEALAQPRLDAGLARACARTAPAAAVDLRPRRRSCGGLSPPRRSRAPPRSSSCPRRPCR